MSNLEDLILSGAFDRAQDGTSSPRRSQDSGDSLKWPDEDYEDGDLSNKDALEESSGPPHESIGMGPGRTGVKGVIRDRAEAMALASAKRSSEISALNRQLEKTSLAAGGRTWQEDEDYRRRQEGLEPIHGRGEIDVSSLTKSYGHLREVGPANYVQAVEDPNARVVVHIYDSSLERCYDLDAVLSKLARSSPNTKFIRVRAAAIGFAAKSSSDTGALGGSSSKIRKTQPSYLLSEDTDFFDDDDPNTAEDVEEAEADTDMLPTMLVYEKGELLHTWVRVDWEAGRDGIENLLFKHNLISRRSQPGAQGIAALSDDEEDERD